MQDKARPTFAIAIALAVTLSGCGGAASGNLPTAGTAATAGAMAPAATSARSYSCPSATTSSGTLNCASLPLGDRKYSLTAKAGYIMTCSVPSGSPVVASAPWFSTATGTWDALAKDMVEGSVAWSGTFTAKLGSTTLAVSGNGLPLSYAPTGTFPIAATDPAYQYDHNPNRIAAHTIAYSLPANPVAAKTPSCLGGGTIGVALDGTAIYDGFDGAGYDAVAREIQDGCHGHPDQSDVYHYHGWLQACVPDAGSPAQNSSLLGYALDGYGIYGPWYGGKVLTSADLDVCHGTTSAVVWNGKLVSIYHYVSTYDFPYTLSCFKGTPVKTPV